MFHGAELPMEDAQGSSCTDLIKSLRTNDKSLTVVKKHMLVQYKGRREGKSSRSEKGGGEGVKNSKGSSRETYRCSMVLGEE